MWGHQTGPKARPHTLVRTGPGMEKGQGSQPRPPLLQSPQSQPLARESLTRVRRPQGPHSGPSSNDASSPTQGLSACEQIRAARYLECSAKFRENVEDVFREAAKVALSALKKAQRQKQRRVCLLL